MTDGLEELPNRNVGEKNPYIVEDDEVGEPGGWLLSGGLRLRLDYVWTILAPVQHTAQHEQTKASKQNVCKLLTSSPLS